MREMQKFREGEHVEILRYDLATGWRKAVIVKVKGETILVKILGKPLVELEMMALLHDAQVGDTIISFKIDDKRLRRVEEKQGGS